mmetsp:Transcript_14966/g.21379  ORF Transcript_14966/g.21379 Transcript_14966/m.21379 type:complete len:109 (-) Transcript_14966:1615-1941(-)
MLTGTQFTKQFGLESRTLISKRPLRAITQSLCKTKINAHALSKCVIYLECNPIRNLLIPIPLFLAIKLTRRKMDITKKRINYSTISYHKQSIIRPFSSSTIYNSSSSS